MTKTYEVEMSIQIGQPPRKMRVIELPVDYVVPVQPPVEENLGCIHLGTLSPEAIFPPKDGLGDLVSNALKSIGITKERWAAMVLAFKKAQLESKEGCGGCGARQKFINWVGSKIGFAVGKGPEVQAAMEIEMLSKQPVFTCTIYGKCLPRLNVPQKVSELLVEADWHSCARCPSKVLKQESKP